MKVLIPTMGTRGDIQPYIALARELDKSGFDAVIATHPCWRKLIEQYNIKFAPIGPDIDIEYEAAAIRGKSKNWIIGAIKTMKFMFKIIENSSSEIMELCEDARLVVASHSQIGAAEAEACGIPYISVTLQPDVIPEKLYPKSAFKIFTEKAIGVFINPLMVGPYNKIRKRLGLKPVKSFDELLSPNFNIVPISPSVYPPKKYWDEKNKVVGYWFVEENADYQPPDSLMNFIKSGPRPIIIALGAMALESSEEKSKLDILVNSVTHAGMRAILQGFNKTLENYSLPDNIISIGSVPHSWLFQHAYCVIHHGGFGTSASALKAGVPSIVIPHVLDQYFWANRIYELKAGPRPINCKELSVENLTAAINTLKKEYSEVSGNVKALSREMNSESGLARTVELIRGILNEQQCSMIPDSPKEKNS